MIGAGFGGSQLRRHLEMGPQVSPAVSSSADPDKLLASTTNVPSSNESDFFYELLNVVRQNFVEQVDDEDKLAVGAVKGMINSLSDPDAQFLSEKQLPSFERALKGEYEGIGVELKLSYDATQLEKFRESQAKLAEWNEKGRKEINGRPEELPSMDAGGLIPDVIVAAVIAGSPAEKAGLKAGDTIDGVDGKWSISRGEVLELNRAFDRMRLGATERAAYLKLRETYLKRTDNAVSAMRLKEKLTAGTNGTVKLFWKSPGVPGTRSANISKALTKVAPRDGERFTFVSGASEALQAALNGGQTNFDLRNSGFGDFAVMREALRIALPKGEFGTLVKAGEATGKPYPGGNANPDPKLTLVVDSSTTGAARLFAAILKSSGKAQLKGDLGSDPVLDFEFRRVQGGAGYVLPIAEFKEAKS